MKTFFTICTSLWLALSSAATAFDIEMSIHPKTIALHDNATLTITIYGKSRPPRPRFPAIDGLEVRGTHQSSSISIQSGKSTSVTKFQYQMGATRTGDYVIGPYEYEIGKEKKTLPAVTLNVLETTQEAQDQQEALKEFVFATIEASSSNVYRQQVFDLTLSLYYRDITLAGDIGLVNMDEEGFSFEQFQELPTTREQVDSRIYRVRRFRANARALTTGTFTLEPILRTQIVLPNNNRQRRFDPFMDGFFGRQRTKPHDVQTEAIEVVVAETPKAGQPDSFAGAIGKFSFKVNAEPRVLQAGDPITISYELSGVGNMNLARVPSIEESPDFKAYDCKLLQNDLNKQQTGGRKVFEQVVIPRNGDITELPPLSFSFFNPDTATYETITRGPIPLEISAAEKTSVQLIGSATPLANGEKKKLLGEDIIYLKALPSRWHRINMQPWYTSKTFFALQAIPPVLFAIAFFFQRRQNELSSDTAKARRVMAPKKARAGVDAATQAVKAKNPTAFYEALWQALSDYFGNRLNLQPGEVSPTLVNEWMTKVGADSNLSSAVDSLFKICESQRYSGSEESRSFGEMQKQLNYLNEILKRCERLK